ncbi:MAG: methionyl-tRNA formyltransferase, partial [Eggerthellaceae bacterium]|nr:methionyl-tRNA formyltransferase [Eggerthellaceae bacterium]
LDPADSAAVNARRVQASSDPHPSRCLIGGKSVTVLKAAVVCMKEECGNLDELVPGWAAFIRKRLYLMCDDGLLEVLEVKPDGKKAMDAKSFAAGLQQLKSGVEWSRADV